jgi:adenylate cyclase
VISREAKRFILKDLESRNGTWVNGRKIKNRRSLKEGDVIQVGPFRLVFQQEASPLAMSVQSQTLDMTHFGGERFVHKNEAESVVKPIGMITNYLSETASDIAKVPTKIRRERLNRNLLTLYKITEELVVTKDLDEMLNYIMDQIFEIFSPSQVTILLRDKDLHPIPKKQRTTEGGISRPVSNTIVNRILNDRVAILTDNALEDPRFEMGESVIVDGIRSVMAAPIWEDRSILGVLYVDRLDIVGGYQAEDLDLLTAIGHQAALAIQRWKLTEQLREEAITNAVIRQNLGRFHSPQVVDLILKGAADLLVKETVATIFFCDMVGFTTLCESGTPEQLQEVLNLFCKTVNQIVFHEQGTLDKFIGDGAMAIFGAPLPQADAPIRAVRAALRIRERLNRAVSPLAPDLRFKVRYGINTGQAIVGNFGSDERVDYTILGHSVNLASRISRIAEPDQVLIGPETYERIKDTSFFVVEKVGSKTLKGLKSKMRLYEVKGFA